MTRTLLDSKDTAILSCLRVDARIPTITLARMLGIPSSTVHDRLRRFRKIGVRYTTLIHWEAMGCSLRVCVLTSYTNVHKILNHPNVNNCFHVSPDLILIEGVFSSMMEIERFQSFLPSARLYTVVEVLKKEGFKHR